jgi:hypothetical protein
VSAVAPAMRLHRLLDLLIVLGAAACSSATGPLQGLEGDWVWGCDCPSGSYVSLSLSVVGSGVRGTGTVCILGPACNPGAVVVVGGQGPGPGQFRLRLTGSGGYVATFSGRVFNSDELVGTFDASPDTIVFGRPMIPLAGAATSPGGAAPGARTPLPCPAAASAPARSA